MPHIVGKRVRLREYRHEDLVPIRQWVNDEAITGFLSDIFFVSTRLGIDRGFPRGHDGTAA
ncbi:hypothetical protein [Cohnella rhizosphaerae]|uniref:hypothetical protein n=1 Tax=Cohnella rhizosphaerae TaxID=1457232 RepID=UPI0030B918A0